MTQTTYTIGVDLGQASDPTAIAVVRKLAEDAADERPVFQVGHLERIPLNTPYPGVVQHAKRLLGKPPLRGNAELVIDFTGVGRPVFDMFQAVGVTPIGVSITSGDQAVAEGLVWKVPKLILISRLQALLHDGRLKIQKELPEAPVLVAELQDMRAEVTDSGHWRFGARAGKHDDLVLALAIAVWRSYGGGVPGMVAYMARERAKIEKAKREALGLNAVATLANGGVKLKCPPGVTHVVDSQRRRELVADEHGCIVTTPAHAEQLKRVGFVLVETEVPA
jgi:hypothetical protein